MGGSASSSAVCSSVPVGISLHVAEDIDEIKLPIQEYSLTVIEPMDCTKNENVTEAVEAEPKETFTQQSEEMPCSKEVDFNKYLLSNFLYSDATIVCQSVPPRDTVYSRLVRNIPFYSRENTTQSDISEREAREETITRTDDVICDVPMDACSEDDGLTQNYDSGESEEEGNNEESKECVAVDELVTVAGNTSMLDTNLLETDSEIKSDGLENAIQFKDKEQAINLEKIIQLEESEAENNNIPLSKSEQETLEHELLKHLVKDAYCDKAEQYLKPLAAICRKNSTLDTFPTTDVLQKSQNSTQLRKIIPPRDEKGCPLPFPYSQILETAYDVDQHKTFLSEIGVSIKTNTALEFIAEQVREYVDDKIEALKCVYAIVQSTDLQNLLYLLELEQCVDVSLDKLQACVFVLIARKIGVSAMVIHGYRKTGVNSHAEEFNVSYWSAVLLSGHWWFVDTFESSLYTTVTFWEKHRPDIRDTFFLSDPVSFIHSHFPLKLYWQQLCRQVQEDEWMDMLYITPHLLRYSIQCLSHDRQIIECNGEEVEILLRYPQKYSLMFECVLLFEGTPVGYANGRSATFIETECDSNNKVKLMIKLLPPHIGDYNLILMGQDISTNETSNVLFHLCTYKVHCYSPVVKELYISNDQHRFQWGLGADTFQNGLINSSQPNGVVVCDISPLHIYFQVRDENRDEYSFTLKSDDFVDCKQHVFQWKISGQLHFLITCPGPGAYVLNIMNYEQKSKTIQTICSYLIDFRCNTSYDTVPFSVKNGKLGLTEATRSYISFAGLENTIPPYVKICDTGELTLKFEFQLKNVKKCFVELFLLGEMKVDMSSYSRSFTHEGIFTCSLILSRIGMYLLSFHAHIDDGSYCNFNNTLIEGNIPSSSWAPFPTKHSNLSESINFQLNYPLSSFVRARTEHTFSVVMDDIHDMAVVSSTGWSHLDKSEDNLWEGTAMSGSKGTDMKLCARFESGSGDFDTLCSYKVISSEDYDARSQKQLVLRDNALGGRIGLNL